MNHTFTTMKNTLTFHSDSGHGWLEVSAADLADLHATPKDFSGYSYRKGTRYFLEEDCDAPKFILLFKAKYGEKPVIEEQYHDGDFVEDNNLNSIRF
jgi:hypothetical protein